MSCLKDELSRGCPAEDGGSCAKLDVFDWLSDIQNTANPNQIVEVRFKNTRKDYYRNVNNLKLKAGDVIAVEASPGHDIGVVSLTGDLVLKQMKKHKVTYVNGELRKVYRLAKEVDIEKWHAAIELEHPTMLKARKYAAELGLNMKIGDVEYQGDKTKAIFYYIADDRVDFRQLIKVYAEQFKIRIEMRQIGARQEAGRIGGIGPCGRELCCSSWMSNFVSVTTNAARYQDISLNPQKLAGQCGKLKCCLNYELDAYLDAQKDFPSATLPLETEKGKYFLQKKDVFKRVLWYAPEDEAPGSQVAISVRKAKEIVRMNKNNKKPEALIDESLVLNPTTTKLDYDNVVGQDSLERFDKPKRAPRKKRRPVRKRTEGNESSVSRPKQQQRSRPQGKNATSSNQKANPRSHAKGAAKGTAKGATKSTSRNNGNNAGGRNANGAGSANGSNGAPKKSRSNQRRQGNRNVQRNQNKAGVPKKTDNK